MRTFYVAFVAHIAIALIAVSSNQAAIVVTGDTSDDYDNTDPWNTEFLSVGVFLQGSMTISEGSDVDNDFNGTIGRTSFSKGKVTVTGAGSRWWNSSDLRVGDSGSGVLEITDGGFVAMAAAYIGYAGYASTGTVTVGGGTRTSTWTSNTDDAPLYVGRGGTGTLNVIGGGTVFTYGVGYIGYNTSAEGVVSVGGGTGTSSWSMSRSPLYVGYDGTATLNITGGGTVSNADAYVGYNSTARSIVTVGGGSGASTWTNTGTIFLGNEGKATLNIETGGLVSAKALAGGNSSSSINFNGGTLRITSTNTASNSISLLSGGTVDIPTAAATFNVSGVISGTGSLAKTGTGNLRLSGSNTYTGTTTISAGVLIANLSSGNNLPTSSLLSLDGGVFASRGTFTRTIAATGDGKVQWTAHGGGFAGSMGPLTVNLGGTSAEQTWGDSLGTTIQGPLIFGAASAGYDVLFQNPIDLNSSATTVDRKITVIASAEMSGALRNSGAEASLTKSGAGTLILSGTSTYTGATTVEAGMLSVSNVGTAGSSSNLGMNSTINLGATTTAATLKYTGSGETSDKVINLAGSTAGASIDQSGTGLLKFTNNFAASGSGAKTLTLQGSTTGTGEIAGIIADNTGGATTVVKSGTGTWTLAGANTYTGTTTVAAGILRVHDDHNFGAVPSSFTTGNIILDGGTLQFAADLDISSQRGITFGTAGATIDTQGHTNSSGYIAPDGGFTGTGDLTKTGSGTFYAATTSNDANTGWKSRLIIKEGTWKIAATDGLPYSPPSSDGLQAQQVRFEGGKLQIAADITSSNPRRGITVSSSGGTIDTGGHSLDWAGPLAGTGSTATLFKTGSGILTFNSSYASTYSAKFNIDAGTVVLRGGAAMGDSAIVSLANAAGVTLSVTDTETIGSLSGGGLLGGSVSISTGLITGGNNRTTSFDGFISGAGGLTKAGTGTMTLTGANSYNGNTTIAAGALVVSNIGTTGNSSNLGTGSTINVGATTISGTLRYTGLGETSDKVINLAATTGGAIIDQAGTGLLKFTSNLTATGNGAKTLALFGMTTGTGEMAGAIVDSAGGATVVVKSGSGTWTLTGANTYTRGTSIRDGILSVASLNRVAGGSTSSNLGAPITVANGTIALGSGTTTGTLAYTGTGETTDRVINLAGMTGGGIIDSSGTGALSFSSSFTATGPGTKTLTLQGTNTDDNTIAGIIVDTTPTFTTSLIKSGAGKWILAGANTYSGATTVSAGTLVVAGTGAKLGPANVTVQGAAAGTALVIQSEVTNAIADTATLNLLGGGTPELADQGYLNLGVGLNERIGSLLLNGIAQARGITFGSTASGAIFQSDEYFAGTGIITVGILGDFNGNNSVDAADFVAWRKNPNAYGGSSGYDLWRLNFRQTGGSGSVVGENAAVPEPATGVALAIAALLAMCVRHHRLVS